MLYWNTWRNAAVKIIVSKNVRTYGLIVGLSLLLLVGFEAMTYSSWDQEQEVTSVYGPGALSGNVVFETYENDDERLMAHSYVRQRSRIRRVLRSCPARQASTR